MGRHIFSRRQTLEKEIKELYLKFSSGTAIAPTATLDLTTDIVLTSATKGITRNADTVTVQVEAAADNPTDTILAVVTGDIDGVIITITPNDGTNNTATPVDLTTAELAELITSGTVAGKTVTLTDASSLLDDLTATGGDATVLVDSGEGDGEVATFAGGLEQVPTITKGHGFASVVRDSAGQYTITLSDKYFELKSAKSVLLNSTAQDLRAQLKSETIATDKKLVLLVLTGTTATDPADATSILVKLELKNSSVPK